MKSKNKQNKAILACIYFILIGAILSFGLYLMAHFNILPANAETIIAPLAVIILLAFGETIVSILITTPFILVHKICEKIQRETAAQNTIKSKYQTWP